MTTVTQQGSTLAATGSANKDVPVPIASAVTVEFCAQVPKNRSTGAGAWTQQYLSLADAAGCSEAGCDEGVPVFGQLTVRVSGMVEIKTIEVHLHRGAEPCPVDSASSLFGASPKIELAAGPLGRLTTKLADARKAAKNNTTAAATVGSFDAAAPEALFVLPPDACVRALQALGAGAVAGGLHLRVIVTYESKAPQGTGQAGASNATAGTPTAASACAGLAGPLVWLPYTAVPPYGESPQPAVWGDRWIQPRGMPVALWAGLVGCTIGDVTRLHGGTFPPHHGHTDGARFDAKPPGAGPGDVARVPVEAFVAALELAPDDVIARIDGIRLDTTGQRGEPLRLRRAAVDQQLAQIKAAARQPAPAVPGTAAAQPGVAPSVLVTALPAEVPGLEAARRKLDKLPPAGHADAVHTNHLHFDLRL